MTRQILIAFATAIKRVLLGLNLGDVELRAEPADRLETGWWYPDGPTVMVGVVGSFRTQAVLHMKPEVSLQVASAMIGIPVTELDELASSAICELGNMIMGNAATELSQLNLSVDITPASLLLGDKMRVQSLQPHVSLALETSAGSVKLVLSAFEFE